MMLMPNPMPLISVIIPCYNAERFVEKAVRSIMRQTYSNLEILCCDDCSADNTLMVLERLAIEDSRIKIIRNETNLKLIDTLNKLVAASNGSYIARMDSDDISFPARIEKQLAFMQQNPNIDFCGCNAFHINETGKIIWKSTVPETFDDIEFFLPYYCAFYHPTIFAKAEVLKENQYSRDFIHAEDYELWCRLILKNRMKGANLPDALFKYRINPEGVSLTYSKIQAETSAKIMDSFDCAQEKEFHKNIFFLHNVPIENEDIGNLMAIKRIFRYKKKNFVGIAMRMFYII